MNSGIASIHLRSSSAYGRCPLSLNSLLAISRRLRWRVSQPLFVRSPRLLRGFLGLGPKLFLSLRRQRCENVACHGCAKIGLWRLVRLSCCGVFVLLQSPASHHRRSYVLLIPLMHKLLVALAGLPWRRGDTGKLRKEDGERIFGGVPPAPSPLSKALDSIFKPPPDSLRDFCQTKYLGCPTQHTLLSTFILVRCSCFSSSDRDSVGSGSVASQSLISGSSWSFVLQSILA